MLLLEMRFGSLMAVMCFLRLGKCTPG